MWLKKQIKTRSSNGCPSCSPLKHCGCGIIGPNKIGDAPYGKSSPVKKNGDPDKIKAYKKIGINPSMLSELGLQFDLNKDTILQQQHGDEQASRSLLTNQISNAIRQRKIKPTFNETDGKTLISGSRKRPLYTSVKVFEKTDEEGVLQKRKKKPDVRKTTKGKGRNFRTTKEGAGMTAKGVKSYRAKNPGSKLKTAVTGKVKPGSKAAKRRKSFCARSKGWTGERGRAARRRWKC